MQVHVSCSELLAVVRQLVKVVPERTPKPVLMNIKIDFGNNLAMATDLERTVIEPISCQYIDPPSGPILVPAKTLLKILQTTHAPMLTFETDDSTRLIIRTNGGVFNVPTMSADDFPRTPEVESENIASVDEAYTLANAFDIAGKYVSKIYGVYSINNILLQVTDKMYVTASDGKAMYVSEIAIKEAGPDRNLRLLIPPPAADYIASTFKNSGNKVSIACAKGKIRVEFLHERSRFIALLADDGRCYPNWQAIVRNKNEAPKFDVVVEAEKLASALRQVAITTDDYHGVVWELNEGVWEMRSQAYERGSGRVRLDVDYDGPAKRVRFNSNYLLPFLNRMPADEKVEVVLPDKDENPITLYCGNNALVVMPMRDMPEYDVKETAVEEEAAVESTV